ncbi:hypothetical protein BC829DRAFT_55429 [Chytridium lagenaria]|nr:hypothetical protein BC829DRAFT_55429 [Chytridium lagenaria]
MDTWSQSNNRIPPDRWPPFDHRSELPADRDRREDTRGSGRGTDPGGGSSLATSIPGRRDPYDDYRPDDRDPRHNRDYPMGRGDGYRPHHHQYHHHHHYYSREERYPPGPPPSGWSGSDRPYRSNPYPTSYNDRPPHHLHRRSLDHSNERRPSRRTSPTNNSSGPSRRDSTPVANDRYEKSDEKSKRPGRSDGDYSPYLGSRDSPTLPSRGGSERVGKVEDKSKRPTDSSTPSGIRDSLSVSSKGGPFERSEEKPRLTDRYHSESGPFVESRDASLSASRGPGLDRLDRMDDRPRRTDRPSQAENSPPNVRREFQPSTQRFDRLDKGEDRSRRNDRAPSDPTPFSAKDIAPLSSRGGPLDDRQRPQDRFSADFDSRDLPSLSTRMGGYSRDEERSRRTDRQQSDFPPSSGQRDYNSSGLREPSVSALPSSRYERGGKDEAGMLRRADRVQAETMVPSGSRDNLSSLSSGGRADKLDKEDGKLVDKVPAEGSVSLTVKDSSSVKRTASPKKDGKDDESLKRADRSSISDAIGSSGSRDPVSSLPREQVELMALIKLRISSRRRRRKSENGTSGFEGFLYLRQL